MMVFHQYFAWVVVALNTVAGAWALLAHYRPRLRSPAMWWAVLVAEATILVQVLAGVWMMTVQDRSAADFHAFYGYATLLAAVVIFSYRPQLKHVKYLLYGLGSLFLAGMALRAIQLV